LLHKSRNQEILISRIQGTKETMDWLDAIVEEQARFYGLPIKAFSELMRDAAEHQEHIEAEGEDS
jgi:hypothetical protein